MLPEGLPSVIPVRKLGLYCPPYLSPKEVADLSGVPKYTLGRWTERGWVTPAVNSTGSGTTRIWHPSVINELVAIREAIERCPYDHE